MLSDARFLQVSILKGVKHVNHQYIIQKTADKIDRRLRRKVSS